ncbi:MAG: hypothetical protein R8K22_07345 [Mariprofundaceae bacterium]
MTSDRDNDEKRVPSNNEGSDYHNDYEGRDPWNTREKSRPWMIYIMIAAACVLLAYVLSGTAK